MIIRQVANVNDATNALWIGGNILFDFQGMPRQVVYKQVRVPFKGTLTCRHMLTLEFKKVLPMLGTVISVIY